MTEGLSEAPPPNEMLSTPAAHERFEQVSAALEASDLVRRMRRHAISNHGTRGIGQAELAKRTGLSQPRVSQIETSDGRDGLSYALLRRIAQACGIDWGQMLRDALDRTMAGALAVDATAMAAYSTDAPDFDAVQSQVDAIGRCLRLLAQEAADLRMGQTLSAIEAALGSVALETTTPARGGDFGDLKGGAGVSLGPVHQVGRRTDA